MASGRIEHREDLGLPRCSASLLSGKVTARIDRELAARPELVVIETAWRSPKEQRPGALTRHQYRELPRPNARQPSCL